MAQVKIHTGDFPTAEGAADGYELGQVIVKWQSVAADAFPRDCSWLLRMVEETDRLKLWERNVDGFTYSSRDEFLREQVLIDFDLTEQQFRDILSALKDGDSGAAADAISLARKQADPESEEFVKRGRPKANEEKDLNKMNLRQDDKPGVLRRLARERPDLLDRIEGGELTANAAAVEAGFRRPMRSIPVDSAESAIKALTRVFTIDELVEAVGRLADG